MKNYHSLLNRQIKELGLEEDYLQAITPLLDQVNNAYIGFENDLHQAETNLTKRSQELYRAKQQLLTKSDDVTNRLTKVAENIKDVIFEIDLNGNWKYLNPVWEKLFGYTVEECIGKPFYDKKYAPDGEPILNFMDFNKEHLSIQSHTLKVVTANNELKWIAISVKGVRNKEGIQDSYIGTIVDISDLKKTELALLKAMEKETLANKAKDNFLSTMSHEIRTPLNAVIGISHLLLLENPKVEQLENLQTLKYSSEHLLGLVNDILDFNKITSGVLELEMSEFNTTHLLNGIQGIFNNKAMAKNIRFAIKKDNSLPEVLVGDSIRLSQIITNLVSNAIKFTEKGKVTLDIEVATETSETCILDVSVKDTGIGIAKEKQDKIFNSFEQAYSDTTRKYGGTGLGLSISKQLLEIMGSTLKVTSEKGKGATFSFTIALKKVAKNIANPPELITERVPRKSDLSGIKILVAEDNKINIMVISKFLSKWKIYFEIAENGKIALDMAKRKTYDMVLMDLQMPVMNGFDSCKLIKQSKDSLNQNTPIFALSASTGMGIKK